MWTNFGEEEEEEEEAFWWWVNVKLLTEEEEEDGVNEMMMLRGQRNMGWTKFNFKLDIIIEEDVVFD